MKLPRLTPLITAATSDDLLVHMDHDRIHSVAQTFEADMHAEIKNEVQRCAAEIRKICPQSRVIVFGSSIDETVRNPRDIDLLVVVSGTEAFKSLRRKILAIPRTIWPLDMIVVPDDFLSKKVAASGNFYAFICDEGIELDTEQKVSA